MSFTLADFVVEQVLRAGLRQLQNSDTLADTIDDIFGTFLDTLLRTKYGQEQLDNLVKYIQNTDISIVNAFPDSATTNLPQVSIISQNDVEAEDLATFCDFPGEEEESIEPDEIVSSFTADSYDSKTGYVHVPDIVDLSSVRYAHFYIDGDGGEHRILTPVSNEISDKRFTIGKNIENLNVSNGRIVSAIDRRLFLTSTVPSREMILVGIHTENSLLTKLLYSVVRYLIYRSKKDFNERQLQIITLQGSDLNQALQFLPDHVYHRFITMSFVSYNTFRVEEVDLADSVEPIVKVEKDLYDREDNEDQTVQTTE